MNRIEKQTKPQRSKDVLKCLVTHGKLSIRALEQMLDPPMKRRRLQDCLSRLGKSGVVTKRFHGVFGGALTVYEIAYPEVAEITRSDLFYRQREHLHSEICAVVSEKLKRIFPKARVLREHEYIGKPEIDRILIPQEQGSEFRPDIILIHPSTHEKPVSIAIEVERSRKKDTRIKQKLNKFVNGSRFDGALYLNLETSIHEKVLRIFKDNILHRAPRIKHYRKYFLLSSVIDISTSIQFENCVNIDGQNISLNEWITKLSQTEDSERIFMKI